ncbi:Chondroitin sulfate synthase 3 [Myotis brandtii]|uniref:Chondroitin sulfate synthase 3 n=1 Tax=Myotis brandtii TaxID=109478 RepID=S7MV62_MYOBR|nr:Chondroitin sulfate synthase 3 [Myotis brandtii]
MENSSWFSLLDKRPVGELRRDHEQAHISKLNSQQPPNAGLGLPPPPLPVIELPGVDDSYPPQKKSFMMIKYMHDHYLDKYEWFMRADDDVYIKGDKLEEFLRSLNSSKPLYLGQTGLGNIEELGKLGLEPGENFCMGGPGMIFSREVLRRMVPHIGECLREMYTTHEDVEVGRCVRRFGGTQCVWSYEEKNNVDWKESIAIAF